MTRYADPERCPDCRGPIAFAAEACPTCGLPLRGALAQRLFVTLTRADELVAGLRAQAAGPVPSAAAVSLPADAAGAPAAAGASVASAPPARGVRLSAVSVPKILLGLGAGCLLVAALVFLVVTWSALGVGGRTATLVSLTLVCGALASWFAHRELRGAAESLTLVALGLLTLDVVGARSAGWLGDPSDAAFLVLLGALLAAVGGAAALVVRRTPVGELTTAQVVAVLGTAVAALGVAGLDWDSRAVALLAAVAVSAAGTGAAHAVRLRVATWGAAAVTTVSWLAFAAVAAARALEHPSLHAAWGRLELWPLLAAAALVAAVGFLPLPAEVRIAAVAVGHGLLALAVLVPLVDETSTELALGVLGVLVASAAGARLLPRPWASTGLLTQLVGAAWVLAVALGLTGAASTRIAALADPPWTGSAADRLAAFDAGGLPAAWLFPLLLLVLGATVWSVAGSLPAGSLRAVDPRRLGVPALLTAGVAALVTAALYPLPVWVLLVVAGGAGLIAVGAWRRSGRPLPLAGAAGFLAVALVVGLYAEWLTLLACLATLTGALVVLVLARSADLAAVAGLLVGPALAGLGWAVAALVDVRPPWAALAVLGALAALFLLVELPVRGGERLLDAPRGLGVAAGAAAAAFPVAVAGVLEAEQGTTWTAVYLTLAGVAALVSGLVSGDRRPLRWIGAALLTVASWVRLADLGVETPEAYTLPAACALLAVGLHGLLRDPGAATTRLLGPGLGLGLVPSLLWAVEDPMQPRSLLLGVTCLVLVVAGARLGWTAPLVAGTAVGAVLVLRLAAPYLGDAVPRWALIGGAGAALIAMGVTWERRLQEARQLAAYVRRLR